MITDTQYNNLKQCDAITDEIFRNSVKIIDDKFGTGYSLKNPTLLSAVLRVQENIYTQIVVPESK